MQNPACIRSGCQQVRGRAASEQAAVGRLVMAAVVISGIGMLFADAERVAKGVELPGDRHFPGGESTGDRLQDEQAGREKRQSPTFASSQHDQSPFRSPRRITDTYSGLVHTSLLHINHTDESERHETGRHG